MKNRAAVEAFEAIRASVAALAVIFDGADADAESGVTGSSDADPLRRLADDCAWMGWPGLPGRKPRWQG
jgi:hypothetical protein